MTAAEYAPFLEQYATASSAPVVTEAAVHSVRRVPGGYRVESERGTWHAPCVVIATGHCDEPLVPAMAQRLPPSPRSHRPTIAIQRNLPAGGVLVVGASASGVQLAEEIQRSGRPVTLAVGHHTWLPRLYRGRDIMGWLDQNGVLEHPARCADLRAAQSQPSMQLVGRPDRRNLHLGVLRDMGVRVVGRAVGVRGDVVHLEDDLAARSLPRTDGWSACSRASTHWPTRWGYPRRRAGLPMPLGFDASPSTLDLAANGIRTVVWATGFRRNYAGCTFRCSISRARSSIAGGITPAPACIVPGLRFIRRRDPSFIDAVAADATELAADIHRRLLSTAGAAA